MNSLDSSSAPLGVPSAERKIEFGPTGGEFLDMVKMHLKVTTDSALAKVLGTSPPYISKVRSGRLPIQPAVVVRVHEETGLSIRDLKRYLEAGWLDSSTNV